MLPSAGMTETVKSKTHDLVDGGISYMVVREGSNHLEIYGWKLGVQKGDHVLLSTGTWCIDYIRYEASPEMWYAVVKPAVPDIPEVPSETRPSIVMRLLGSIARWLFFPVGRLKK